LFSSIKYLFFKIKRLRYIEQLYSVQDPWSSLLNYSQLKGAILESLGSRHYNQVLDIGCGEGLYSSVLAGFSESYIGIDISDKAISIAEERAKTIDEKKRPFVRFCCLDFDEASQLKNKFDLLVFNFTMDYLGFQDHPGRFVSNLFDFLQSSTGDFCGVLLINPIYKEADLQRVRAYQQIFEKFNFETKDKRVLNSDAFDIAFLYLEKTRTK
jgi:SAM-dependent methyltransferase